jgi:hypothetical protein
MITYLDDNGVIQAGDWNSETPIPAAERVAITDMIPGVIPVEGAKPQTTGQQPTTVVDQVWYLLTN